MTDFSDDERPSLYPLTPGHSGDDTSYQAARDGELKFDLLKKKCLRITRESPQHDPGVLPPERTPATGEMKSQNSSGEDVGITSWEASQKLRVEHYSIHPRFSELRAQGLVRDSGVRRVNDYSGKSAICWVPGRDPKIDVAKSGVPDKKVARSHFVAGMEAAAVAIEDTDPESAERIRWAALRLPALPAKARAKRKPKTP